MLLSGRGTPMTRRSALGARTASRQSECMSDGATGSRRFSVLPQTALGRRAAVLLAVGMAFFAATTLVANVGGLGGSGWLAVAVVPAFAAMFGGAIAAAVAVVRRHERGGIALIPLLGGLYLAFLLIGELIAPHE
jgi:hypothetical protein